MTEKATIPSQNSQSQDGISHSSQRQNTWSINELSTEFSVTPRSIRFYEGEGLLFPKREGQRRIYSKQDRVRLRLILRGKRLGFSLGEIRELFQLYDESAGNNDQQLMAMIAKVHERQAALEQQLRDIRAVQDELRNAELRCWDAMTEEGRQQFAREHAKG